MISIIPYSPQFHSSYKSLNLQWLMSYNLLEPFDEMQLDDPEKNILDPGGFIFLAQADDLIVGTSALVKMENDTYELAKMTVSPAYRGRGISKLLIEKCIQQARELNAKTILLYSNSALKSALSLYEKYGFKYIPSDDLHYTTADIKMILGI